MTTRTTTPHSPPHSPHSPHHCLRRRHHHSTPLPSRPALVPHVCALVWRSRGWRWRAPDAPRRAAGAAAARRPVGWWGADGDGQPLQLTQASTCRGRPVEAGEGGGGRAWGGGRNGVVFFCGWWPAAAFLLHVVCECVDVRSVERGVGEEEADAPTPGKRDSRRHQKTPARECFGRPKPFSVFVSARVCYPPPLATRWFAAHAARRAACR